MNDWKARTARMVRRLRLNSIGGGLIALLLLAIASLTAGANGFTAPLGWWLLLAFCLAPLALAAHLLFDAFLFRIALSYDTEEEGLTAIDDVLARMGLRERPAVSASLSQRFSGCRRLILIQRLALFVGIVLYGILAFDAMNGVSS